MIRKCARKSLCAGLAFGIVIWALSAAIFVSSGLLGPPKAFLAGSAAGILAGLISASRLGGLAFVQNYAVRATLVRAGFAPRHYEQFLNDMAERMLLRRLGNGYIFAHQLLRDYLAEHVTQETSPATTNVIR